MIGNPMGLSTSYAKRLFNKYHQTAKITGGFKIAPKSNLSTKNPLVGDVRRIQDNHLIGTMTESGIVKNSEGEIVGEILVRTGKRILRLNENAVLPPLVPVHDAIAYPMDLGYMPSPAAA